MEDRITYETADEFLKGGRLKRTDVVLTRARKSFISKLIMCGTKSNWSHTALIFVIADPQTGYDNTFVIESIGDGIDITNLRFYLEEHAEDYDVGIKRLESGWFAEGQMGLKIRRRIRGNMLNFIKAEYDFATILQIARMVLRKIVFGIQVRFSGLEKAIVKTRAKKRLVPGQFICSGFVQYAFYDTINKLINEGQLDKDKLNEVIFNPRFTSNSDHNVLLATTPEDIAKTDKLKWKYVAKKGKVYEVGSNTEVEKILKSK
jgi:hypothetical protein